MRKIKRTSLALLISPILFIGCMQHEKGSSIIPAKSTDNRTKFEFNDENQTSTPKNQASLKNNVLNKTIENKVQLLTDSSLDQLAQSVLSSMDIEITGNKEVTTQPILIEEETISHKKSKPIDNTLKSLADSVIANLNIKLDGDKKRTTKPLEVGKNWKIITKEDEILETAKEFLGVKYVWAANGPSAFDCSGFTKYVFKKHGVTLPRYSGYQAHVGQKIAYKNLRKGDLVFFGTEKIGKVNHVGIYLGHHKFIHASSGGHKVMITSFTAKKFYRNRFLHGQRIVNSGNLASL